ncbi:MAG: hypothetical protein LBI84_08435, partial [Propionibacteriaceae bacterium]|nr:hypothetical protein [Propionibacteriaceae bacterium]
MAKDKPTGAEEPEAKAGVPAAAEADAGLSQVVPEADGADSEADDSAADGGDDSDDPQGEDSDANLPDPGSQDGAE